MITLKKTYLISLVFVVLSLRISACGASEPQISAQCAVLYDPLSEQCLYAKEPETAVGMASTTKIMTALVALEQYDIEQQVSIQSAWTGIEGSSMYLKPGERLTVSDLLYGLMLASGNDAAEALAGLDPNGTEGFVRKMNQMAAELNLTRTHFENPSGLDGEGHYTTALDLARLTAVALQNPHFAEIVSTRQAVIAGRTLTNHNRLLADEGVIGVKTGYTKACGRCLVTAKQQNGRVLICVTLHAPDDWEDHRQLLAYGFSMFQQEELVGAGDCGSVALVTAGRKASRLYTNDSFSFYTWEGDRKILRTELIGPRFLYGGTLAGECYGTLRVRIGETVLFETPVYFGTSSAEREVEHGLFEKIKSLFRRSE